MESVFSTFLVSLRIMVEGWLGVFLVMGVIIGAVYGLNYAMERFEAYRADKET